MTIEEARALIPVLEQVAYLNAGTFGPLARTTLEAMETELRAGATAGRVGMPYFEHVLGLRDELRGRLAALVGVDPGQVSLTGSTTDGCNIVAAGLDLGPEDEVVTTADEHSGLILPLHTSGVRVVVARAGAGGDSRGRDAEDEADRRLARPLDDGPHAAGRTS